MSFTTRYSGIKHVTIPLMRGDQQQSRFHAILRKVEFAFLLCPALYVGTYVLLSFLGSYEGNFKSMEKLGFYCSCVSDRLEWQPKFIIVTDFDDAGRPVSRLRNRAGYLFFPLLDLDRLLVHRTQPFDPGK
jgi:hypothetical protein